MDAAAGSGDRGGTPAPPPASVLVVDDEAGIRSVLSSALRGAGWRVDAVESGEACLESVGRRNYDVILLDVWLPGRDGLATLEALRKRRVEAQVVVVSGHGNIESAVRAIKIGAFDFLEKPFSLDKALLVTRNALRQRRLEVENRELRAHVDRRSVLLGDSLPMTQLRNQIEVAAPTNGRVLIVGANGTGKELVARSVHAQSRRAAGPFVEMNCAAIPEELLESELFGHARGAFTGAVGDRAGKFRAADGGTLFLDEVGDMTLRTQAKMLRVLEEQVVEPLGGDVGTRVDVRVIAATNKDLTLEIRNGRFRNDLFFRLDVIRIAVPLLDKLQIDDVVGAIPAHLVAGVWGTLAVGIFSAEQSFIIQLLGVVIVGGFMVITSGVVWYVLKATVGIRVSEEDEELGLDKTELGLEAYPEFGRGSQTT